MKTHHPRDLIIRHCQIQDGFPRPDWDAIEREILANTDEVQRNDAWNQVLEEWLGKIIEVLGESYWLGVTKDFPDRE